MLKIKNFISFIFIIIFSNILIIKTEFNNTNIISLKFKTYYPYTKNSNENSSFYNEEDYYFNYHLSKIYLEMGIGDENNYETNTNQSLNVIVDLKEIILSTTNEYFEKYTIENNNLLCNYNTSKSTTLYQSSGYYDLKDFKSLVSYASEYFKIYTDIYFSKYNITKLNFVNTINHNKSNICGNIGLTYLHHESISFHLIGQLYSKFNLPEYSILFNYSSTSTHSDEGNFIFGNMPHVLLPDIYNIDNLYPIYSTSIKEPTLIFNKIQIGDNNIVEEYGEMEIKINPDIEGFVFPVFIFEKIEEVFFQEYYNKSICHYKLCNRVYKVIECDGEKGNFGEKNIKSFPKITFYKIENFSISFTGEDLFYIKNNKYFFKIIEKTYENYFVFGRILFKKYTTVLNQDKRQIYFYINKNNNNEIKEKNNQNIKIIILIIIICTLCVIVFFFFGIFFGKKIFQKRGKLAYELNDGYDYNTKNDNENYLIN